MSKDSTQEPLIFSSRSRLDKAIVELLWEVMVREPEREKRGVAPREIGYVLGSWKPKRDRLWDNPQHYKWLDKYVALFEVFKAKNQIDESLAKCPPSRISRSCNRLHRRGVLDEVSRGRYRLGNLLTYPDKALMVARRALRSARIDDTWSNGFVTLIGLSRLKEWTKSDTANEELYKSMLDAAQKAYLRIKDEITDALVKDPSIDLPELIDTYEEPTLPVIVIDFNVPVALAMTLSFVERERECFSKKNRKVG